MTDRAELLLKLTATHFLHLAVSNLHLSLKYAAEFESTRHESVREVKAQYAAYHQFAALEWDEKARACGIDSDEMHKFMHAFFATGGVEGKPCSP